MDRLAIAASGFCLVHCLVTPVLLISIPVLASTVVADEQFHGILLMFVLPTSSLALLLGCRRHKDWSVLILGTLGLILLVLTASLGHEVFGEIGEKIATIVGSMTLAAGHLRNRRLCRADKCDT
jgi:peptidoglycan/LPS O-acetylase OafA/YrhL